MICLSSPPVLGRVRERIVEEHVEACMQKRYHISRLKLVWMYPAVRLAYQRSRISVGVVRRAWAFVDDYYSVDHYFSGKSGSLDLIM